MANKELEGYIKELERELTDTKDKLKYSSALFFFTYMNNYNYFVIYVCLFTANISADLI